MMKLRKRDLVAFGCGVAAVLLAVWIFYEPRLQIVDVDDLRKAYEQTNLVSKPGVEKVGN